MKQLTTRGQLGLLLVQKGFFSSLISKSQPFMEEAKENPDVFYSVFYQPDKPGQELLLELIVETSEDEHLGYERISLDAAKLEGGKLFDSLMNDIWGTNYTS